MDRILIVGGGAAGMSCAVFLARKGASPVVLERGERLGRKLSASGNGQGNITNLHMGADFYHSDDLEKVARALSRFSDGDTVRFLESIGGIFLPDERGRVYPAGRQASAVTDLLRGEMERLGVKTVFGAKADKISARGGFVVSCGREEFAADAVVLAAGGRAAPQFGTDGNAYALAEAFGHTVAPCSPRLVQLRTDPAAVRGLKGIRVDAVLRVLHKEKQVFEGRGDVLFTESGVSGDAVFRASSFAEAGDELLVDLLPDVPRERVLSVLRAGGKEPLLCVVNNGLGRVLSRRAGDLEALADLLKGFRLTVTGTLGYGSAQVTRGGIPLAEVDDDLMSRKKQNLYFAGEILNVDGVCGGYNLQWAFTSAYLAAEGILK